MKFSKAIKKLKNGKRIYRDGWNGKNQYVTLAHMNSCTLSGGMIVLDPEHKNIGSQFLMFVGTSGYQCGWLASQADILAEDWRVIDE